MCNPCPNKGLPHTTSFQAPPLKLNANKTEWTRSTAKPEAGSRPLPAPEKHVETPVPTDILCFDCGNPMFLYDQAIRCIYDGSVSADLLTNTEEKTHEK